MFNITKIVYLLSADSFVLVSIYLALSAFFPIQEFVFSDDFYMEISEKLHGW